MGLNPDTITVSGYSSGGYFAQMMHVIFSSTIKGSAEVGAGPYTVGDMPDEGNNATREEIVKHCHIRALENEREGLIDPLKGL